MFIAAKFNFTSVKIDLVTFSPCFKIAMSLNTRPRKCLNARTPNEIFQIQRQNHLFALRPRIRQFTGSDTVQFPGNFPNTLAIRHNSTHRAFPDPHPILFKPHSKLRQQNSNRSQKRHLQYNKSYCNVEPIPSNKDSGRTPCDPSRHCSQS